MIGNLPNNVLEKIHRLLNANSVRLAATSKSLKRAQPPDVQEHVRTAPTKNDVDALRERLSFAYAIARSYSRIPFDQREDFTRKQMYATVKKIAQRERRQRRYRTIRKSDISYKLLLSNPYFLWGSRVRNITRNNLNRLEVPYLVSIRLEWKSGIPFTLVCRLEVDESQHVPDSTRVEVYIEVGTWNFVLVSEDQDQGVLLERAIRPRASRFDLRGPGILDGTVTNNSRGWTPRDAMSIHRIFELVHALHKEKVYFSFGMHLPREAERRILEMTRKMGLKTVFHS